MNKIALIILDGVGMTSEERGNAVIQANAPYFRNLFLRYPKALLKASAEDVGMPWGEFGNSEVGHTNIGLGRVVLQDLPQIDKAFESGAFLKKETILEAKKILAENKSNLHLIGIASDGSVHGKIGHIINLVKEFKKTKGMGKIILHLIADGRDVAEKSIENYLEKIKPILSENVIIGTLSGRYYAMDRNKNWDRIAEAYNIIIGKVQTVASSIESVIENSYAQNITDEFIKPAKISDFSADLDHDVFIFTNFRADRAIQLTRAFVDPSSENVKRVGLAKHFIMMTTYDDNLAAKVLFSNINLTDRETNPLSNPLVEIISKSNLRRFHIAETEKFAHITYFLSGGKKDVLTGQENKLIQSEKMKTYETFPQMRAREISQGIINAGQSGYDFIVANYANGDMVGHSGNLEATIKAVEILDECLSQTIESLNSLGYEILLTADHGNCDEMIDLKSGKPNKEHSLNPVPLIFVSKEFEGSHQSFEKTLTEEAIGILADIAPTILSRMGFPVPSEMTGTNLLESLL